MNKLEKEICELVFETVPLDYKIETITAKTTLKSLCITSLETIDIIFELEEKYNIDIETEAMFGLKTMEDVAEFIDKKLNKVEEI